MASIQERLRNGRTGIWDGEKIVERTPSSEDCRQAGDLIDTLVEALKPFAAVTASLEAVHPSAETVTITIKQSDLVGALAAVMLADAKRKIPSLNHSHSGLKRERE